MESAVERIAKPARRETRPVVHVVSRRFGTFEVPADRVLRFPHGLIGFPEARRFVILEHRPTSPFKWMLCVDDPELAFAVADPAELVAGYRPPIEAAARLLGIEPGEVGVLVIVTIPPEPSGMTVNLMAPVAVDLRTRQARQIVLEGGRLDARHPVLAGATPATTES
jgi:flagellar assembly factor FliW